MALLASIPSCHHDPHHPGPAFVASCSTDGAAALFDPGGISHIDPHWELSADHVEHHLRGAKIHLAARVDAKQLEAALRCQAARVDRKAPDPGRGVLEVSAAMPEIVVTPQESGTLVVIAALNDRDGERIFASAKALAAQR